VATMTELEREVESLRDQLSREKKNCALLKKRALQAIVQRGDGPHLTTREDLVADPEAGSRVKSVFLENVSHEIRSSMNGIIGMTNLVLETKLDEEQRTYLEMVGSSVDRLLLVVNEVLDFSKIETGDLEIETEDFALKECLDHDLHVLNLAAKQKGITLLCEIAPEVPAWVNGDPLRLVQVVTSLVNNAIKFTPEGGVVLRIENLGYDGRNRMRLQFSVEDTGCGLTPDQQCRIASYFQQPLTPYQPLSLGSRGLGLTISAQLVKLMGGEIRVSSGETGSTFQFTLPFAEVADFAGVAAGSPEEEDGGYSLAFACQGKRVLLAEDEYINRLLIETMLRNLGVEVVAVEDGRQAVAAACDGGYQLVLMDVQMAGMDGLEATRRIRENERKHGGHLNVVALTALAMPGDREKCLQAGMDDYLAKPVERGALVDILTRFLTNRALVLDDDPRSRALVLQTLIEEGWRVTIAETERSAMYEASLSHFPLIVLDLAEGVEAVRMIRELEKYSGQRALIMGLATGVAAVDLPGLGIDAQLQRPLQASQLRRQLSLLAPSKGNHRGEEGDPISARLS
jgi:signal transduction histidine kinase/DNA-binding response OmpR family regulator